ncbi:MAG: 30S ribosomal protein S11 [bacterium]|nr:30S ribosomal protein S11 [bacterium]
MGKKRIASHSTEELLKERETVEAKVGTESGKGASQKIKEGRVYVISSYNNILMSLTDPQGNVLGSTSSGSIGFKGSKKATPFAASKVAEALWQIARQKGVERATIHMRGVGAGRDSALRSLGAKGIEILSIHDTTPIPHNGPRRPRARRV